jgi:hypothetical protein
MYVDCRITITSLRFVLYRTGLGVSRSLETSDINSLAITVLENILRTILNNS